ncbi:MAG: FtsB family cell division protein [Flavobacteriales bacterium]
MERLENLLQYIPKWMRNKYVLVGIFFVVWLTFFDQNSMLNHAELSDEIEKIEEDIEFYNSEIEKDKKIIQKLDSKNTYERIAREKYLMKRPNEDVFIIKPAD